jgi:hypothetical protein
MKYFWAYLNAFMNTLGFMCLFYCAAMLFHMNHDVLEAIGLYSFYLAFWVGFGGIIGVWVRDKVSNDIDK